MIYLSRNAGSPHEVLRMMVGDRTRLVRTGVACYSAFSEKSALRVKTPAGLAVFAAAAC